MAVCEQKINQAMAKVEQIGIASNNNKPMNKATMAVMREVLIQAVNFRQEEHDKEVSSLKENIVNLEGQVNLQQEEHNKEVSSLKENIVNLEGQVTVLTKDNQEKDKKISELCNETVEFKQQIDSSSQYNRRDNIKFTGIPQVEDENLVSIIQDVTKHIGREITEQDISDIHRLPNQNEANGGNRGASTIICRLNRRRVKYEVMDKKKHLRSYPHPVYSNLGIYEDLTPLRSRMLYALRNRTNSAGMKEFKFTWSKEGRIFCRTEQQTKPVGPGQKLPKPGIVNKPSDLLKLGFNEQEVQDIINNKRK